MSCLHMSPLSWLCPPHACHNNATIIGDVGRPLWKSAWPSLRRLPKALVQLELLWENASHQITKWICDGSERNIIGTELVLHLYRNSPLVSKRCTTTNDAHLNGGWSPPLVSMVSHFLNSESHRKPDRLEYLDWVLKLTLFASTSSRCSCHCRTEPATKRPRPRAFWISMRSMSQAREWQQTRRKMCRRTCVQCVATKGWLALTITPDHHWYQRIPTIETCCMFKMFKSHESGYDLQKQHCSCSGSRRIEE